MNRRIPVKMKIQIQSKPEAKRLQYLLEHDEEKMLR
jgi:hypothetical protein